LTALFSGTFCFAFSGAVHANMWVHAVIINNTGKTLTVKHVRYKPKNRSSYLRIKNKEFTISSSIGSESHRKREHTHAYYDTRNVRVKFSYKCPDSSSYMEIKSDYYKTESGNFWVTFTVNNCNGSVGIAYRN